MTGTQPRDTPVGVVGLGVMGSAVSALLLASDVEVVGHDVDAARMVAFTKAGGRRAASAGEVAEICPVVLTLLPSAAALDEVVSGPSGLARSARRPLLVVEMSTLSLADKQLGRRGLESAGARLVDAPLSGTGAQARTGDLIAFVSGDHAHDRALARMVLAKFTRAQYDVGAFGNGSRFKYVANLLVAIHNVAAAEALVLAEKAGLDVAEVMNAVSAGAGTSRMFEVRGPLVAARSYDPTIRLEVFMKDVALIGEYAESVGAWTPLLAASREVYLAACAAGYSGQDPASVAEVLRHGDQADGGVG